MEGSVSLEYIHSVETNLYTSDELSGKRMSWVGWRYTHKQKLIMKYLEELLTLVALMAWFTYGYLVLIAVV